MGQTIQNLGVEAGKQDKTVRTQRAAPWRATWRSLTYGYLAGRGWDGEFSLLTTKITFELSIPRQRIPQVQPVLFTQLSIKRASTLSWDH